MYSCLVSQCSPLIGLFLSLLGVGFIIAFHEYGHFITAKFFNLSIPDFSIGFGPKLFSKKIGETTFSLSLVPIGGYVAIETGSYDKKEPRTIASLSYLKKILIILGGILFNLLFSYVIFVGFYTLGTTPKPFFSAHGRPVVALIKEDSIAEKVGLIESDRIMKINEIDTLDNIKLVLQEIKSHPGKEITLAYQRQGIENSITLIPDTITVNNQEQGSLGVEFSSDCFEKTNFLDACKKSLILVQSIIQDTFNIYKNAFKKKSTATMVGPLYIISFSSKMAQKSLSSLLLLLANLSIGLAVMNVFPLPILDGGQALTYTIEALIRRPLNEKALEYIHITTWILMLLLTLYISFKDVILLWTK